MTTAYLGIDVGKSKLDCALMLDAKLIDKTFENSPAGLKCLWEWVAKRYAGPVLVCMEATGGYEQLAATTLFEAGHTVCVVNPLSVHAFAKQRLTRSKTDVLDARTIAQFASRNHADLGAWQPPPKELTELRDLVMRRQALVDMKT